MDDLGGIAFNIALARLFRMHAKAVFSRLAPQGVFQGQPRILRYLIEHPGCAQRDIASDNDLEPATVTGALSVMEKRGLVKREGAAGDRRAASVSITAKGRRAYARALAEFARAEELAFRGFSASEKEQALACLSRLYRNLKEGEADPRV
jgi:DNA-binding MarR family transcriptional regulator